MTDLPETTRPAPSDDDRRCAADVLRDIAGGHCSFGAVSPDAASAWRRVADWLEECSHE